MSTGRLWSDLCGAPDDVEGGDAQYQDAATDEDDAPEVFGDRIEEDSPRRSPAAHAPQPGACSRPVSQACTRWLLARPCLYYVVTHMLRHVQGVAPGLCLAQAMSDKWPQAKSDCVV